jgi:tRNA 2-thiouridine synthesizing protein A
LPSEPPHFDYDWDAGDIGCGDLVIRLRFKLKVMQRGQIIRVHASDPGAQHDLPAWCRLTGETLLAEDVGRGIYFIQRRGQ